MDVICILDEPNISSGQIMSVVTSQRGGVQNVNFAREEQIISKERLQAEIPSFYYDIKVDDDNTASICSGWVIDLE